jgi:branched-chain amino acid transport system substrate-binding protein
VAATFAFKVLGLTKAATLDDGDPYTQGLSNTFQQAFTELGGLIVLVAGINKGDTDMGPVLTAVTRSGAELLYAPVFPPERDYVVLKAREMEDLENITIMGAEGFFMETFIENVGESALGVHAVIPATPGGPAYDALASRFEARYGQAPTQVYFAHSHDAVNMLLNALEAVAVVDADGTLHIGRQALRHALYATSGHEGLTGSLTCDAYGDCGVTRFQVIRLDDPAAGLEGWAANVLYSYPPGQ